VPGVMPADMDFPSLTVRQVMDCYAFIEHNTKDRDD
jgi:hypothetical protein